ncbi:MAG: serine/threonine-protein kinase [Myxococcota bacterium]
MLRHPNTITLFDYDKTDQGVVYMAFEFIDGPTITELIKSNPNGLPPKRVIHIAKQVALSLQEAHEVGIIHRDLKPGNIMLTEGARGEELIKVLDFGIAKMIEGSTSDPEHIPDHTDELSMLDFENLDDESISLTHEGRIVGTPRYIPPEQVHGHELTGAADLYSLGLIMHELLTGVPANSGKKAADLIKWHLKDRARQTPDGFEFPEGLGAIIDRATRRKASLRYSNCTAFLADLEQLDDSGAWRQEPPPKTNPWPLIIAANVGILLLVLTAAAFWAFSNVSDDNPTATAETPDTTSQTAPDTPSTEGKPSTQGTQPTVGADTTPNEGAPSESDDREERVRVLEVTTEPTGVSLFIDDAFVGVTPFKIQLRKDSTPSKVVLRKRGYMPAQFRLKPDSEPDMPIILKKRTAPRNNTPSPNTPKHNTKKKTNPYHILTDK